LRAGRAIRQPPPRRTFSRKNLARRGTSQAASRCWVEVDRDREMEEAMGFGKGALLWLIGIPLPVIILLALFWHH
jgi:hypothetical protein